MISGWIQSVTGHTVSGLRLMPGATSSSVYAVTFEDASPVVLRLFTNERWLANEPDLATHEAAALAEMEQIDLPTPQVIALDADGSQTGVPAVLMTLLPGTVDLRPDNPDTWLAALAEPLNILHASLTPAFAWKYDPWIERDLQPPEWTEHRDLWTRAFALFVEGMPRARASLLHRDYHPTNVLWTDGAISGIVDWVNTCVGPPSADVAHCRLNLALMYGYETAERFLECIDDAYDPIWDLAPALSAIKDFGVYTPWTDFGLQHLSEPLVRERLEGFVGKSLATQGA
ncbi:MAG: phosphotransferase [Gammaproteobacteria bacterium]|nr:phosphotransferase [Gammaproteobacteria bacterium]